MPETIKRDYLEFFVPGKPQGKQRPRVTKTGQAYTPKDTQNYENLVKVMFSESYPHYIPGVGYVNAIIIARFPLPEYIKKSKKKFKDWQDGLIYPTRKPDLDNMAKIVLDSLNGLAYADDSQVINLVISKVYDLQPGIFVRLEINRE